MVDFLIQLPSLLDVPAIQSDSLFKEFAKEISLHIDITTLSEELQCFLYYHSLILNTTMDKARFISNVYKNMEKFDILSLLEVIQLYLSLELNGVYYSIIKSAAIPKYENVLKWAHLLLDAGLLEILGNKEVYESILGKIKEIVMNSIARKEGENQLKVRMYNLGVNKSLSLSKITQSDVVLETIYL